MDIPKPHPPVKKIEAPKPPIVANEVKKPPFVRKPHLTDRPFRDLKTQLNAN